MLPGILLGEELYQHILRVFVGSEVDVACPMCGVGPVGPMPKLKPFRVAGHFYTGMYEFDSKLAYVSLRDAQKFLGMEGEVTGIEIRTTTPEAAIAVASEITRRLGPTYEVRSWEELNRGLYAALKLEKLAMFIALSFIALVASFSIIANLIMMVTEKAREVAILKSMGARDGAILRIFFAEGLYIGILGLLLGDRRRRRGLPPAADLRPAAAHGGLLHREDAGGHARHRDRRGRPGGAGAVLPGDHLPGACSASTDAPGGRPPVRVKPTGPPGNPS